VNASITLGWEMNMKWLAGSILLLTTSFGIPAQGAPDRHASGDIVQIAQDRQQDQRRDGRGGGTPRGPQAAPRSGPPAAPNRTPQAAPDRGPRLERGPGPSARARTALPPRVEHGPRIYEKRAFQRNYIAPRRFRLGIYRSPQGWVYRRWVYGQFLPPAFWVRNYWVVNFWLYGLDRPPLGCEWVRYGDDALLVDVTTGEILQVVYNVFY
jgi:Ni/Co efflux regulator RcnB